MMRKTEVLVMIDLRFFMQCTSNLFPFVELPLVRSFVPPKAVIDPTGPFFCRRLQPCGSTVEDSQMHQFSGDFPEMCGIALLC